jgi:hypothetical protein
MFMIVVDGRKVNNVINGAQRNSIWRLVLPEACLFFFWVVTLGRAGVLPLFGSGGFRSTILWPKRSLSEVFNPSFTPFKFF